MILLPQQIKRRKTVYATIIVLYQWELYHSKDTDIKLELSKKGFPSVNILKSGIKQIHVENPITVTLRLIFYLTHSVRCVERSY